MREIKFRAWYVHGKQMITVDENAKIDSFAKVRSNAELFRLAEINTYELMQYTGLKDKNGVEICEGDILKVPNSPTKLGQKNGHKYRVVVWGNSGFLNLTRSKPCEVPGNIYENPELVK